MIFKPANGSWLKNETSGFTLIEVLLYVVLASMMLGSMVAIFSVINMGQTKAQIVAEVDYQGFNAVQIITQTIRNAESINSPLMGVSDATLSLGVYNAFLSPTVFSLSSGKISMIESSNPSIDLTSPKVSVSNLLFENLSRETTAGNIRVSFTISYNDTSGKAEYLYSKNFSATASLR
jgi:hypothetical protein